MFSLSLPLFLPQATKEKVKEYFLFFEQFQAVYNSKNHRQNIQFNLPIPNTAVPSNHTREDGQLFANYCRITKELERENRVNKIFSYYRGITSYKPRKLISKPIVELSGICPGHCGNGRESFEKSAKTCKVVIIRRRKTFACSGRRTFL